MHLWPSSRIRDSFKKEYLKKLDWNLGRMKSEKESQNNQKLLDENQRDVDGSCSKAPSKVVVLCRELLMLVSCFYCCFCCGACVDEEEK